MAEIFLAARSRRYIETGDATAAHSAAVCECKLIEEMGVDFFFFFLILFACIGVDVDLSVSGIVVCDSSLWEIGSLIILYKKQIAILYSTARIDVMFFFHVCWPQTVSILYKFLARGF